MPCGCVVDIAAETFARFKVLDPYLNNDTQEFITECPWCLSTFGYHDLFTWFEGNLRAPVQLPGPSKMLLLDDYLLESVGRCECGAPIVRRYGSREPLHCDVPSDWLSPVRH